jgi:hypothetical protein
MPGWYILDENHMPIPEPDSVRASLFFADFQKRCVAQHEIGEARVSTVFLCLDHNYGGDTPVLFETLVTGGPLDDHMTRYFTWDEALLGHTSILKTLAEPTGKPWQEVAKVVGPEPPPPRVPGRTAYERLLED